MKEKLGNERKDVKIGALSSRPPVPPFADPSAGRDQKRLAPPPIFPSPGWGGGIEG